jgi:hypothetical protein
MAADGILTDRTIGDTLTLPYSYDDLKIRPNTIIDSQSFNEAIERINKNFLYLVSYSKIPTTNIPINYTDSITIPTLNNVKDISFTDNIYGHSVGVICNSNTFLLLSAIHPDGAHLTISDNVSATPDGVLFDSIRAVDTDANNNAYVLDKTTIYKYDISGATQDDSSLKNLALSGRNLTLVMGGSGFSSDKDKFANPISFSVYNDDIYVIDQPQDYLNGFLKIYDTNLNFKSIHNITSDLKKYPVVDIMPSKQGIFVLTLSGHILEYDNDINLVQVHKPNDKIAASGNETYIKLESSKQNDNIFYVLTNLNVFKKYKSKPSKTISRFSYASAYTSYNDERIKDYLSISIKLSGTNDEVFIADQNLAWDVTVLSTGIDRFIENEGYQDAFFNDYQTQIFELSSLYINKDEYVNNFVFNKSFSKILHNHFVLKENARFKFQGTYDIYDALIFDGVKYPLSTELTAVNYATNNNNYLGVNEVLLSETINRPIKEIYDLQSLILKFLDVRATNTVPISSVVVGLPSS